jgi:hypothetical protein
VSPRAGAAVSALRFYVGLFLVAACTLMLQIVQTRILSVVTWYHLAFFAISMAMFGLTAGAVWLYLRRDRFTDRTLSHDLSYYSTAFAVSIALSLTVQMALAPMVARSVTGVWAWMELALCIAVPFYFSGVVVSLALTRSPFPIGRVYAVDLVGAAAGCLGVLLLLDVTDGPSAVLAIAAVAAAAASSFAGSGLGTAPSPRPPFDGLLGHRVAILAVLAGSAVLNGVTDHGLQPLFVKGRFEDGASHLLRKWNTFSRVAVHPEATAPPILWGASPTFPRQAFQVSQRSVSIDGDAGSVAYRFRGDLSEVAYLKYDVTTLAYHLPGRERVAVIGVGSGRDVLSAAMFGAKDIVGIEINPTLVRLLTRAPGFSDFTNLAQVRGLRLVVDEGRSWLARPGAPFDVIQMSLIDTWAATGAGAFSLSENGLYTVEAWKIFLGRLSDKGVFTVSRWYNAGDPGETGRMLSLAVASLMEIGAAAPARHIYLAASGSAGGSIATLIVARRPLSPADLAALRAATAHYQYRELVVPSARPESDTLRAIVGSKDLDALRAFTSRQEFDLTPPTDDRPFFFNQLPFGRPLKAILVGKGLVGIGSGGGGIKSGNLVATATLVLLFCVSLVLVLAAIVVPARRAIADAGRRLAVGGTAYFLLIGAGFMLVEIGLLQRMSVFLGHPVYSLSVSLFTLILATGAGSLTSDRLTLNSRRTFVVWAAVTGIYIFSLRYWLSPVLLTFDGATLPVRAAVCVAVIAPAGWLMGFAFPTGLRIVSGFDRRPAPWFWGINGAAGVLASVAAVALSIALGIGATLAVAAACYVLLIPVVVLVLGPPRARVADGAAPR